MLAIDHLDCRYTVPRGTAEAAVRSRLDGVATTLLPVALRNRIEPLPADDDALCFIERVEIEATLGSGVDDRSVADRWAESLWIALAKRLRTRENVVVFRDGADYVASFLVDLVAAPSETRWYFAELRAATDAAANALLVDPDTGREALAEVHRRGRLHDVLQLLGDSRVEEVVTRCLLPPSPEVVSASSVRRWIDAVRSVRFIPTERREHDTAVLLFETLALHPELGPDVNLARFITRLLALANACGRNAALAAAIAAGDYGAVRALAGSAEQTRFVGSLLHAAAPREIVAAIRHVALPPAETPQRTLYTDHAGVFFFAASLVALELELTPLQIFLVAHLCLGDADRRDTAVAAFAGLPELPPPDAFEADDPELPPIAAALLRHFAGRLGPFADSGAEYLRKNFLDCRGIVTVSRERMTVRFLTCPMRVVLRMCGLDAPVELPWCGGRMLEIDLER